MKLTGASTTLFRYPAPGRSSSRAGSLLELTTDEGMTGIAIGDADLRAPIAALFQDFLKGEDPRAAPGLWHRMQEAHPRAGRARAAIALIDVALWDLKARMNNEPLWKTLGGSRLAVNACASRADATPGARDAGAWFEDTKHRLGFRSGMLRSTGRRIDGHRLEQVRDALANGAGEPELGVDTGGTLAAAEVIRRVRTLEKRFDIAWIALGPPHASARGLRQVSDSVRAAACAGRGLCFPRDFHRHFQQRSIDLVQVDLRVNGITGALQLAEAAYGYELPVMLCAAPGNIHVHLAGAMPYVMNAEITEPAPPALYRTGVRIEDGRARPGKTPGTGITVDRAALARATVDRLSPRGKTARPRRKK